MKLEQEFVFGVDSADGNFDVSTQDGRTAKIFTGNFLEDDHMFFRILSGDDTCVHPSWSKLVGKRVRVILETVED